MGIDYSPVLYLGKQFESQYEAKEFYEQHFKLSDKEIEFIEEDGFSEFMYSHKELSGTPLNCYSGYGFVLGIDLSYPDPLTFADNYVKAINMWKKSFGDEPYDLIHEVCVS